MNNLPILPVLLAGACMLSGCNDAPNPISPPDYSPRLDELDKKIRDLQADTIMLKVNNSKDVWLKLSATGFSPMQTDIGTITIQMTRLEPIGSGTKVHIKIGNPTSADIVKLEMSGKWGPIDADGNADFLNQHEFKTTIGTELKSGSWTNTSFILDGAKPNQVGVIDIERSSAQSIELFDN